MPGGCTVSAATADCHSGDGDGPAAVFEHERCAGCAPQARRSSAGVCVAVLVSGSPRRAKPVLWSTSLAVRPPSEPVLWSTRPAWPCAPVFAIERTTSAKPQAHGPLGARPLWAGGLAV